MSVGSEFQRSDAATGKERRPTVVSRKVAQAAAVTMKNEVGGDWVGRRRELAGSDRVALDRVIAYTKRHDSHLDAVSYTHLTLPTIYSV